MALSSAGLSETNLPLRKRQPPAFSRDWPPVCSRACLPSIGAERYLMRGFFQGLSVSEPRKHHYVPVCYLKQWANTGDRRLCEYRLILGGYGVKARRTSPDGTGYKVDLYRVEGVPEGIAQDFEKRFMHFVDTDASRALEEIIAGNTDNWPGPLRSGWTRFILSLLFRNPEAVDGLLGRFVEHPYIQELRILKAPENVFEDAATVLDVRVGIKPLDLGRNFGRII